MLIRAAATPAPDAGMNLELANAESEHDEPAARVEAASQHLPIAEASERLEAIKASLERSDEDAIEYLQRLLFGGEPLALDVEEEVTAGLVQYLFDPEIASRHFSFLIAFVQMTKISERALADEQYAAFFEQVQQWVDQFNAERAQHERGLREQVFEQVSKHVSSLLELRRECLESGKPLDRSMHAQFARQIEAFETDGYVQWFYMYRVQLVESLELLCTGPRLPRFEQAVIEKLGLDPSKRFKSPYKSQIDLLESRRRGYEKRIELESTLQVSDLAASAIESEINTLILQPATTLAQKTKLDSTLRRALAKQLFAIDKTAPGFWLFERGSEVYEHLCRLGGGPSPQTRERIRRFRRRLGYRNFIAPLVAVVGVVFSCALFWLVPSYWLLGLALAATYVSWWRFRCCP